MATRPAWNALIATALLALLGFGGIVVPATADDVTGTETRFGDVSLSFPNTHLLLEQGQATSVDALARNYGGESVNLELSGEGSDDRLGVGWFTNLFVPAHGEATTSMQVQVPPDAAIGSYHLELRGTLPEWGGWYVATTATIEVTERCCVSAPPPEPQPDPQPFPSVQIQVSPSILRAEAGTIAEAAVILRNVGDASTVVILRANEDSGYITTGLDHHVLEIDAGSEARTTLRVAVPDSDTGRGVYRLVVEAQPTDGAWTWTGQAWLEVPPEPCCRPPPSPEPCHCPPPVIELPPVQPRPTWGHPTPDGFRVYIPLDQGAFTLPIFVHGKVEGGMLVLDVEFDEGAAHSAE